MTNMLRRVKSRKGFTLTELIVVVAIVGLLMICVTAFAGPIKAMVRATTADTDAITINEIAGDYIERRLAYADCIQIYLGANAVPGNTTLKNGYDNIQGYRGANDSTGMLVFKMIEDTSDPKANTYRIFDVPITDSSKTTYTNSFETGGALPKNPVFSDDYYGKYQHLILLDPESYRGGTDKQFNTAVNEIKGKAYLNFDIYSYYFDESTTNKLDIKSTTDSTLEKYYKNIINSTTDPDNGISSIAIDKTAYEHVSFELQNIEISTITGTDTDGSAITIGVPKKVNSFFVGDGDDIVIYYNVKKYSPTVYPPKS